MELWAQQSFFAVISIYPNVSTDVKPSRTAGGRLHPFRRQTVNLNTYFIKLIFNKLCSAKASRKREKANEISCKDAIVELLSIFLMSSTDFPPKPNMVSKIF